MIGPDVAGPRSFSCILDIARVAEGPRVGDSFSSSLGSVGWPFAWSTELRLLEPDSVTEEEPLVMVDVVPDEWTWLA